MKIETAVRRERDGKLFFGAIHALARLEVIGAADAIKKVKELFDKQCFVAASFYEPMTDGFVIDGVFHSREETAVKLNLGCPSLAETDYLAECYQE